MILIPIPQSIRDIFLLFDDSKSERMKRKERIQTKFVCLFIHPGVLSLGAAHCVVYRVLFVQSRTHKGNILVIPTHVGRIFLSVYHFTIKKEYYTILFIFRDLLHWGKLGGKIRMI